MRRGECVCKRFKKALPILVLIFIEYGGLNQMILRIRFHLFLACESGSVSRAKAGMEKSPPIEASRRNIEILIAFSPSLFINDSLSWNKIVFLKSLSAIGVICFAKLSAFSCRSSDVDG